MKRLILCIVLLTTLAAPLVGDEVSISSYTPLGYGKISVTNATAVSLDLVLKEASGAVFITVESNNIRYRIDGGDPDSDDGHLVVAANFQNLWFTNSTSIRNLRMIGIGGTATVIVTYYRKLP